MQRPQPLYGNPTIRELTCWSTPRPGFYPSRSPAGVHRRDQGGCPVILLDPWTHSRSQRSLEHQRLRSACQLRITVIGV